MEYTDPLQTPYFIKDEYDYTTTPPTTDDEFQLRCIHQLDELMRLLHLIHHKQSIGIDQYRYQLERRQCIQLSTESIWLSFVSGNFARSIAQTLQLIFQGTMPLGYPDWITIYPEFIEPVILKVIDHTLVSVPPEKTNINQCKQDSTSYTTNPISLATPNIELTVQKCRSRGLQKRPILTRQAMV